MFAEERRQAILHTLRAKGRVQVSELAQRFKVADETIRRDLKWLEENGQAVRTHGGAVCRQAGLLPPLAQRVITSNAAKEAIGRAAAQLVNEGESIFIDSGSTGLELARQLRNRSDLHVVTNSLLIAGELAAGRVVVHMPGGSLHATEMCLIGPDAVEGISGYRATRAFICCAGVNVAQGVAVFNPFEAEVKKAMLANAAERIVIADNSKLGNSALFAVAKLDSIDRLITDSHANPEVISQLRKAGWQVDLAQ